MLSNKRLSTVFAVISDFSAAPFRLMFLTACVAGCFAALTWTLSIAGLLPTNIDPLTLHLFLFLQSFAGASFTGFLLTAIPEWTHYRGKLTRVTQIIWSVWLIATICVFFSLPLALTAMLILWLILAGKSLQIIWLARDDRQISVLIWLVVYILLVAYLAIIAWQTQFIPIKHWEQILHISILGVALISFRISRALGEQALEDNQQIGSRFIPNPFYKNLSVLIFYVLIISNLLLENKVVEGWISLAVAGVMLGRLREWHFSILLKAHYVRWLYLTLLIIGLGYAWRGIGLIMGGNGIMHPVLPLHLIAIGGFLLMSFQVFNIAGLRHSNKALIFPKLTQLAMLFFVLAAIFRSLLTGLGLPYTWTAIYIPTLLCALGFSLYIPVFYRIFSHHPALFPSQK